MILSALMLLTGEGSMVWMFLSSPILSVLIINATVWSCDFHVKITGVRIKSFGLSGKDFLFIPARNAICGNYI